MSESVENIFQIGEAFEQRLVDLEDKLEDQINNILDLSRIGTVFTSLLDLNMILPMLIETALRIVKGEVGEVVIFDYNNEIKSVNWGLSPAIIKRIKTENGINIIDHVKRSGDTLILNDLEFTEDSNSSMSKKNIKSILCAPLKTKEKIVGAITIANKENQQEFDADDKFSLELLGNFAAVAVMNVELHEEALVKQKMEHELDLAEQVQRTLMPEKNRKYDDIKVFAYHDQAGQVGGDFYDIIKLSDKRYLAVIADVSSKGMPAALIMASVRSYIRVVAEKMDSLAELVSKINNLLCDDVQKLGGMFVTMFFCVIDLNTNKLYSVNAGHPPGYLIRDEKIEELKTGGIFVGQFSDVKYKENTTELKPGDKLIVYTDGLFECVDSEGEMLGLSGLLKFLLAYSETPWDEFTQEIKNLLKKYSYDHGRIDDTTLVKIEVK